MKIHFDPARETLLVTTSHENIQDEFWTFYSSFSNFDKDQVSKIRYDYKKRRRIDPFFIKTVLHFRQTTSKNHKELFWKSSVRVWCVNTACQEAIKVRINAEDGDDIIELVPEAEVIRRLKELNDKVKDYTLIKSIVEDIQKEVVSELCVKVALIIYDPKEITGNNLHIIFVPTKYLLASNEELKVLLKDKLAINVQFTLQNHGYSEKFGEHLVEIC